MSIKVSSELNISLVERELILISFFFYFLIEVPQGTISLLLNPSKDG